MQTYVLHDADLDGLGAKYAAWKEFGDDAEYTELSHGTDRESPPWDHLPDENARVFVLDYSWDVNQLYELGQDHDVLVIDHHQSLANSLIDTHEMLQRAIDGELKESDHLTDDQVKRLSKNSFSATLNHKDRDGRFKVLYDENRSAACLSWMYFHQSEPPRLLRHVEDRDLWDWEMDNTDEVLKGLEVEGTDVHTFERYADNVGPLISTGRDVCEYRDGLVEAMAKNAVVKEIKLAGETYTAALTDSAVLYSRVGHRLLDELPETDIAILLRLLDPPSDEVRCSLRSREDGPDVSEIAEAYGGAGLENAAGCAMSITNLNSTQTE